MKQISQQFSAASLYVAGMLLLCLGSCQSGDNANVGENVSVRSLPLTARISETSSRVGMTDTYGGTFSCYWNSDKFSVYHKYRQYGGAVQNMAPLEFGTSATSGTSATFFYKGGGAYCYNPGLRLYTFSKGTNGGYTTSVVADGTSTLTAPTLANQNGTLSDCATYDALYGSANVDSSTGLPETLTMNHLFGMLNLHLTSNTFYTNDPVTVTLNSSAANILPGNGGTATLSADGGTLTQAGTDRWSSSWSVAVTPAANGVLDIYMMTWPFSSINGMLSVSCSDGIGSIYTARTVTLSGFSLSAAQFKSKPLAIFSYGSGQLFAWDAKDYKPVSWNTAPTNANTSAITGDYLNRSSYACKNCPNANEVTWYLSVPCYWDNGTISGGNTTNYKLTNGSTTKAGMWFRKSSGIDGFSSTRSSAVTLNTAIQVTQLSTMSTSDISALNLRTDYFFLPAAGKTSYDTGIFSAGGEEGNYWSSSSFRTASFAYALRFSSSGAYFINYNRACGFCLWLGQ